MTIKEIYDMAVERGLEFSEVFIMQDEEEAVSVNLVSVMKNDKEHILILESEAFSKEDYIN